MKISTKLHNALNKQINHEFYAAYLYLSMAANFEATGLKGFAHWMHKQAEEEVGHAMKIFNYLNERGNRVALEAIDTPKSKWTSVLEAFEDAYKHEVKVTGLINDLMNMAIAEKDHATSSFLQWYVDEQVEEEASAMEIIEKVKMAGEALYMLDKEMAARA